MLDDGNLISLGLNGQSRGWHLRNKPAPKLSGEGQGLDKMDSYREGVEAPGGHEAFCRVLGLDENGYPLDPDEVDRSPGKEA